jgi:hypothetical protein
MGPAYFIIAIMGCGEGDAACQQVRTLDTQYRSEAACSQATETVLPGQNDVDYPVVVAQCMAAGATPKPIKAAEVTLPDGGTVDTRNSPLQARK